MTSVGIMVIGSEILRGDITDTNSGYLMRELARMGLHPAAVEVVDDISLEIRQALSRLASRVEVIITGGGLGPTTDDITRYAIADEVGRELIRDEGSYLRLQEFFRRRGRPMSPINERQAFFPEGAMILENSVGSADCFICELKVSEERSVAVIALPGVPRELKAVFHEHVVPYLRQRCGLSQQGCSKTLKVYGRSESYIGEQVERLVLPREVSVSYRASFPEVWVRFQSSNTNAVSAERLHDFAFRAAELMGSDFVFSTEEDRSQVDTLAGLLTSKGLTLAVAESCTGGAIADRITSTAGVSSWFLSSVVSYSNESKEVFLGVIGADIRGAGAVSREVAMQMAEGVRLRSGASIGVATTGIAGPEGGSAEKPVGTLWVGISDEEGTVAVTRRLVAERNMFRVQAAAYSLDLVRRRVSGLPLEWEML